MDTITADQIESIVSAFIIIAISISLIAMFNGVRLIIQLNDRDKKENK